MPFPIVHDVAPGLSVRVTRQMPELAPELDAAVESLWQAACSRAASGGAGRLFNGPVFSADHFTPAAITGHMTEFRRVVAQMRDPTMFARLGGGLGLRQFAVCGVLRCAGGVLIGRRHRDAVYEPGLWQLPPAGSVDGSALRPDGSIDIAGALLAELTEELGLPPDAVDSPRPICVVEHEGSHVCDLGLALRTSLSADAVLAAHRDAGNGEYDPLLVVPEAELPAFVAQAGDTLVPSALVFMKRLGLLPT